MKKINLACGAKLCLLPGWENVDFQNSGRKVKSMNLIKRLKYTNDSIDVIYHSQFIEHLTYDQGVFFLQECYRILKKGGVMRLVTPDLENQVLEYLSLLKELKNNPKTEANRLKHQWIKLEILDQLSRNQSGGEQVTFLNQNGERLRDYISERLGRSGIELLDNLIENYDENFLKRFLRKIYHFIKNVGVSKYSKVGKFRLGGEIHYTVYDSFDLRNLLEKAGFNKIELMKYNKSNIPEWDKTLLDQSEDGLHDGKNCLFIEVIK
jgi:predicted SAM-dependent methyltransferase